MTTRPWQPGPISRLSDLHVILVHTAVHRSRQNRPKQRISLLFDCLTPAMAHPSRRIPSQNPSRYYAVPQSPQHQNHPYGQHQQRRPSRSNRAPPANDRPATAPVPPRNDLAQGVATGAIGAGYGPYSVRLLSSLQTLVVRLNLSLPSITPLQ